MVRLTLLARLVDGLPLAEGVESDKELEPELESLKPQAKAGNAEKGTGWKAGAFRGWLRSCRGRNRNLTS